MRKVKLWFFRWCWFLIMHLRIYTTWSKIHRFIFDRIAKDTQLPTFKNIEELVPYLRGFGWRADSWIDLGDAICSPEMVWYRYLNVLDHKVGDCDDFAAFTSNVIQKSIDEGVWESDVCDPQFMTVTWLDAEGRIGGHNVCLLSMLIMYGYIDYDVPRWCGSKENTASSVLRTYGGPGASLLGWAVHSPTLKKLEVHRSA